MTGSVLAVRVQPGAARTRVVGAYGDGVKLQVAAPPEDGKANAALLKYLAQALALPPGAVTLAGGAASRSKRVKVSGLDAATAKQRLLAQGQ